MKSNRSRRIAAALGTAAGGGLLAVGLSIGPALATPAVAAADPSTDPYSWTDQLLGGVGVPGQTSSGLDMQVSIDGKDLFPTDGNTATATSGTGDIAIAIGDGANANASGGTGDFAFADGANSLAEAGFTGDYDTAVVFGANSTAEAGFGIIDPFNPNDGLVPSDFDLAAAFGNSLDAYATAFFHVDIAP
jgi:hypothetical protein